MKIEARVVDLVRRIRDDQTQVGYSMIKRLVGRGDAVCDPHHTRGGDEKREFSGLDSKPVATVYQWFGLKTTVTVS
jgi:hypothetical protein